MNFVPIALSLATAFLWAMGQILGKLVMRNLSATIFNTIRLTSVAIMLTPIVFITGLEISGTWPVVAAIIAGVFGVAIPLNIYFYCMKRAPAHKIVTIGNTSPVWAFLLALLFLGEGTTLLLPFSLALVIGGSILFVPRGNKYDTWAPAIPLTLAVAVLWGLDQALRKSAVNVGIGPLTFIWISMVSAAFFINLTAVATRSWKSLSVTRRDVGLSLASAISAHVLGSFCYMLALEMENVSSIAPFTSVAIPFGFLLSILIVGERPTKKALAGMVVVFFGVILAAL